MGMLCLDLGVHMGWAYKGNDGTVKSGVVYFPLPRFVDTYSSAGIRFSKFRRWLEGVFDTYPDIDCLVYELVQGHRGAYPSHAYGGFLAILTMICHERNIPYSAIPAMKLKRLMTGSGASNKFKMMEAVQEHGYDFSDDNEADALALLIVMCDKASAYSQQQSS